MKHLTLAVILVTAFVPAAYAQQQNAGHSSYQVAQAKNDAPLVNGEVRKIDQDAKKLTIRHGPIPNLDMPAMTMVYQVKNPAMLEKVNAGDKIKFSAEKLGGAYTVTRIEVGR